MATPTLAKSPQSDRPYDGNLIEELTEIVIRAEKPKPPQPETEITRRSDEERKASNAELLNALWILGEQMGTQAFELPLPKPDPLSIALNGFPDFASSQAYYAGND